MHGVPADLGHHLEVFRGTTLTEIGVGQYVLNFRFDGGQHPLLGIEGDWELLGPDGQFLDGDEDPMERDVYRVQVILGQEVVGYEVDPPESFALLFASGHRLRVFDHNPRYESCQIQPGNVII